MTFLRREHLSLVNENILTPTAGDWTNLGPAAVFERAQMTVVDKNGIEMKVPVENGHAVGAAYEIRRYPSLE
jgi:hypothetical protein